MEAQSTRHGSLFSHDYLEETIATLPFWPSDDDLNFSNFRSEVAEQLKCFPTDKTPNETQTEDDLIWPILSSLGWVDFLREQNLSAKGRDDVPDGLLFLTADDKARANGFSSEYKRYNLGGAIVESKRWDRPLDRRGSKSNEQSTPSSQILRYLRRVDDLTTGGLRWGILTNGSKWRLYFSGARSLSEQFFEIDLKTIFDLGDANFHLLERIEESKRIHWLKVFYLMFRKAAFERQADDKTFHESAIKQGQFYEERVANSLSDKVFNNVYPTLVRTILNHEPKANTDHVREAALIILYRLLFVLYAEDRDLLPANDSRYDDYGIRHKA